MKVLGVIGWSGSGKTTLIEALLPLLRASGLTVSTVKHAHHGFDMDRPGKDSFRHREAGAQEVMVVSGSRWALLHEVGNTGQGGARAAAPGAAGTAGAGRCGAGGGVQDAPLPEARGAPAGARQAADLAGAARRGGGGVGRRRWTATGRCCRSASRLAWPNGRYGFSKTPWIMHQSLSGSRARGTFPLQFNRPLVGIFGSLSVCGVLPCSALSCCCPAAPGSRTSWATR